MVVSARPKPKAATECQLSLGREEIRSQTFYKNTLVRVGPFQQRDLRSAASVFLYGDVAQLAEQFLHTEKVVGSDPTFTTKLWAIRIMNNTLGYDP